jgi:hypothetical protein
VENRNKSEGAPKEMSPLLANSEGIIKDVASADRVCQVATESCSRREAQQSRLVNNVEGKRAAVLTSEGVQRLSVWASSSFKHTIVSREAARKYGLERRKFKKTIEIMGPTGVLIWGGALLIRRSARRQAEGHGPWSGHVAGVLQRASRQPEEMGHAVRKERHGDLEAAKNSAPVG